MRRRRVIIFAAAIFVAIGVVVFWPGPKEPQCNGKKLSEWLEFSRNLRAADPVGRSAQDQVRQIGTNALPWLVRWLNYDTPPWKDKLRRTKFFDHMPQPLQRLILKREIHSANAYEGFRILCGTASPAIPDLAGMITNYPRLSAQFALLSLSQIGDDAIWPLLEVATNKARPFPLRDVAFNAITSGKFPKFETDENHMSPLVPVLIPYLHENGMENPTMRLLSRLGMTPNVAFYVFTNAVTARSAEVRVWAVHWVGKFGTNAAQACPELKKCLQDSDAKVRQETINVLLKIAPEALTNSAKDF